ncbi:hypothetical protein KBZ21_43100, partial [Streptomyces sp. A73]|nr:hypothetical protein [Streptomyces sp. A73]
SGGPLLTTDFHTYYWSPVRGGAEARAGRYAREAMKPGEVFAGTRIHLVRHAHKAHMDEDGHPRVVVEERQGHRLQGVDG